MLDVILQNQHHHHVHDTTSGLDLQPQRVSGTRFARWEETRLKGKDVILRYLDALFGKTFLDIP